MKINKYLTLRFIYVINKNFYFINVKNIGKIPIIYNILVIYLFFFLRIVNAIRDAEIADLNLVSVSSIKPPHCKIVSRQEGRKYLMPGQIVFAVMARSSTNEPNRLIASSIGLARPADDTRHGYISEHHSFGETAQKAGDYAEDMAMEMLATTLGLPNDSLLTWDQREEQWKLSGKIYKTQNVTQSAEGHKDGLWTIVISAVILIL